jgi:hypothetical protein
MSRWLPAACFVFLLTGCVPVSTPLSDPTKAEPDKRLLGKWLRTDPGNNGTDEVDMPVVKGNPKGLMRVVNNNMPDDRASSFWFFTTTVGKHNYMTVYVANEPGLKFTDFRKEGEFAKYIENKEQRYFIFQYTFDDDQLVVDGGTVNRVKEVMEAAKIDTDGNGVYKTPDGWLAKYLTTRDPTMIFNRTNMQTYRRAKP